MSRTRFRVNPHRVNVTLVFGSIPVAVTETSDFAPASRKAFLDIQATMERGFTLKRLRDMTRTYSKMHRTDKYS